MTTVFLLICSSLSVEARNNIIRQYAETAPRVRIVFEEKGCK